MVRRLFVILVTGLVLAGGVYVAVTLVGPRPAPAVGTNAPATAPTPSPPPGGAARNPDPAPTAPDRPAARRAPAARDAAPRAAAPPPEAVEAAPTVAILDIDTDVPGAQVFINREFIGAAPIKGHEVAPGSYRLNVSAPGFDGLAETIEVAPGARHLTFNLRDVRLDAGIDVVHKHRIGSCQGRLIATPQGLRYETTDKADRFSAALLDLDTFEVDYLKKNLKVKPRKGRSYDFTDPAGDADHLFVFHRDVDNARARLRKGDPAAPARGEGSTPH